MLLQKGSFVAVIFSGFVHGLMGLFIYKIGMGRNWARISILVWSVMILPVGIQTPLKNIGAHPYAGLLAIILFVTQLVALALLFQKSSSNWFKKMKLNTDLSGQNCKRISKIKLAIFLAILAAGFVLYDSPLKPEVKKIIQETVPRQVEQSSNIYLAMLGFAAPLGEDIHAVGLKKLDHISSQKNSGKAADTTVKNTNADLVLNGKLPDLNDKPGNSMRRFLAKQPAEVDALLASNHEIMERYRSLRNYRNNDEPVFLGVDMPLPSYKLIFEAQRLEQLRLMRNSNPAEVLNFVREDLAFWRNYATHNKTLIGKVIAYKGISRNYYFISEYAAAMPLYEAKFRIVTEELLMPIPNTELSLASAIVAEIIYFHSILSKGLNMGGVGGAEASPVKNWPVLFVKQRMTLNTIYDRFTSYIKLSELPLSEFTQQYRKEFRKIEQLNSEKKFDISQLNWVNPVGQILANLSLSESLKYTALPHNLEGSRRLALLKLLISRQKISDSDIPASLAKAGPELSDPFTGKPMSWDSKDRKLFYKDIGEASKTVDMFLE